LLESGFPLDTVINNLCYLMNENNSKYQL
jgi:hypothetical protein